MDENEMKPSSDVVSDTIAEIADRPDRSHALRRLADWRDRVHRLYDEIQKGLGNGYFYDRAGKHATQEEIVQQAGIRESEVPAIDILRIEGPHRRDLVTIYPRHLWIIGANGRLDLAIPSKTGIGRRQFMLLDVSRPMSSAADWRLVAPADQYDQRRFTVERLRELIE